MNASFPAQTTVPSVSKPAACIWRSLGRQLDARPGDLFGQEAWYFRRGGYEYVVRFEDFGTQPRSLSDYLDQEYQHPLPMPEGEVEQSAAEAEAREFFARRSHFIEKARKLQSRDMAGVIKIYIHDPGLIKRPKINQLLSRISGQSNPVRLEHRILGELYLLPLRAYYLRSDKAGPTDREIEDILFDLVEKMQGRRPVTV